MYDILGKEQVVIEMLNEDKVSIETNSYPSGNYILHVRDNKTGQTFSKDISRLKSLRNVSLRKEWVEDGIRTRDPQNHNLML